MNPLFWLDWLQQNNILLFLCAVVLLATIVILLVRRHSRLWWSVWGGLVLSSVMTVFVLHSAPVSISAYSPVGAAEYLEPLPNSVAELKTLVTAGEKPTLVEFYVDYGFN